VYVYRPIPIAVATLVVGALVGACGSTSGGPTTATRSTTTGGSTSTIATSPPTQTGRVVYQSDHGLAVMRPDGTDQHLLLAPAVDGRHPDWSPDGTRLAYEVDETADDTTDIWVSRSDGTDAHKLVDCKRPCSFAAAPAWSPDGTRIAYTYADFPPSVRQDIRIVDVATGRGVRRFTFPDYEGPDSARWSPDGTMIAFTLQRFRPPASNPRLRDGAIGLLNVDGKPANGHAITPWSNLGSYPAWSPNGEEILFQAGDETPIDLTDAGSAGHTSDLWIVRPDGSGLRQLTHQQPGNYPRLITPDWGGGPHPFRVGIFNPIGPSLVLGMLDADGSNLQPITSGGMSMSGAHPRWIGIGS
jgi:TolB protein